MHRTIVGNMLIEWRGPGLQPYVATWEDQRAIHADVVARIRPDTVLLLEHEAVFTAGRRTEPADLPTDGTPVVDVDRGGRITWHGPGQLVGYPIVHLPEAFAVVDHVRRLEEVLIGACADVGLATLQVPGRSGVWVPADHRVPERKIAAIGVRVAQGVTMHGFALNCDCDMSAFGRMIPCGITDAGVTSLSLELNEAVSVAHMRPFVEAHLHRVLGSLSPTGVGLRT